jgi:cyanate lyase
MHEAERRRLAERLRACKAASGVTEDDIARSCQVDQPFVSRLLLAPENYQFETPKVARVIEYVKMQEMDISGIQIELPFETNVALRRFLAADGDVDLLNSLIDVLASRGSAAR